MGPGLDSCQSVPDEVDFSSWGGAEKNASRRGIELVFVAVDVVAWCPLPLLVKLS